MGLLVIEKLDPVFDPAQEDIAVDQFGGRRRLHQATLGQTTQRLDGRTGADFGKLPAPDHLQQLHGELDLADATA